MILAGHLMAASRYVEGDDSVSRQMDFGAALKAMRGGAA